MRGADEAPRCIPCGVARVAKWPSVLDLPRETNGKLALGRARALRASDTATHVIDFHDGEVRKVEFDAAPGLDVLGFHADGEDVVALDAGALIVVRFRLE